MRQVLFGATMSPDQELFRGPISSIALMAFESENGKLSDKAFFSRRGYIRSAEISARRQEEGIVKVNLKINEVDPRGGVGVRFDEFYLDVVDGSRFPFN